MSNLTQFQSFAKQNKQKIVSNNKAVIYTRVSSAQQQDNTSLESQRKYCTEFSLKKNLDVLAYFGGTYESAKTDDRKEYQKMLAFVRKNKVSNIIVYSIDRFSRSGASAIATLEELKSKGINVLSVTQPTDTKTSTGTFFQNINLLFSKYDNDQRREKTITGMRQRLLNGYWMGNAPLGYKNARNKENIPILEFNDDAKFIRKAFQWKVNENLTNVEIVNRLQRHGYKIYKQRLTNIFRNPIYCGLISHSLLEGKVVEGKHKPIVSKDLFLKANGIQARNNNGYKQNKVNENLPLKGFVSCIKCNSPLTGFIVKKKNIYYYKCKTNGCSCTKNNNKLHEQFTTLLSKYKIDDKFIAPLTVQMKNTFAYYNSSKTDNTVNLKYSLKKINEKIDKIEERFVIGEINSELYQKFIKKFSVEKLEIEREIKQTDLESSNLEIYLDKSLKLLSNVQNVWRLGNYSEKQKLQKLLFPSGITFDKENDRVQTQKVNSILQLTNCLSVSFNNKKSGQKVDLTNLSARVTSAGFKPATA